MANSTVIPGLRYRDAVAMIDWLCEALGFEKNAVYMGPDGTVAHAQLVLGGGGMVMVGSVGVGAAAADYLQPSETGGRETQAPYLVVEDCDATYARAKAAGAEIMGELAVMSYGGKGFSCRDPEGHQWHVGSYNPWV